LPALRFRRCPVCLSIEELADDDPLFAALTALAENEPPETDD
jgi:hypothetical protein